MTAPASPSPAADPRADSPREHTLLVVDDDVASRKWMIDSLSRCGHRIIEATNGAEALAALRAHRPCLMVMDVEMPGLGGVEVCRIVKANQGPTGFGFIPVILVTASQGRGNRIEGLELGADDYLIKPFAADELTARVNSMLRLKALHDELLEKNRALERANRELEARRQELDELSRTDPLTGVANRRAFDAALVNELLRTGRHHAPLALLMLDVDHFKRLNDTHGHPFGDRVLQALCRTGLENLRQIDLLARYGGEEFAVLLPATPAQDARLVAERLRLAIAALRFPFTRPDGTPETLGCTVSIGIATTTEGADVANLSSIRDAFIAEADAQLYAAKQAGRNRTHPLTFRA
jgi:diguanylate cyclase (GGDEF)-like protein